MRKNILLFLLVANALLICTHLSALPKAALIKDEYRETEMDVQEKIYTGRVVDTAGNGLQGVSVSIEGATVKTMTGAGGYFRLEVNKADPVFLFSNIGYKNVRHPTSSMNEMTIIMEPESADIDEVVVVGFGKQKRSDMIGSVTSVNPSNLKVPSSNLTTALVGRVAGVIGFQRSGEPGADNANFFIRGVTTFGYKVDPLILIDNVEATTTDLARLQLDDIESFSIMKDATATAIYGARGANGVVLITTKEGKEGAPNISVRYERSLSEPTSTPDLADPVTYMRMHNEAVLTRGGYDLPYKYRKIDETIRGSNPILYPVTDWRKELMQDHAVTQRFHLNVSGGGDVARYFVSGAVNQDNGILKVPKRNNFNNNIDLKTYSLRSNVNIDLSNTTELLVRLNGSFDDYTGPLKGGTQVYRDVMRTNPVLFPAYYEPGEQYKYLQHIMFGNYVDNNTLGEKEYLNPYADLVKGYKQYSRSMMLAQLEIRQKLDFLTEGLAFRAMGNTTRNGFFSINREYKPFYYMPAPGSVTNTGDYRLAVTNETRGSETIEYAASEKTLSSLFYLESALTYNRVFQNKHSVSGLLVGILQNRLYGNPGSLQLSLPFRNLGLSGRFTYSYDSRYFLEGNFGYNGSERFHESNRFGFFPSAGVAWSISNEEFWKPLKPVFSNLRLRATYGIVGNDAIGADADRFYYLSEVDMTSSERLVNYGFNRGTRYEGVLVKRYGNNDITWEQAYKTNVAIEIGLFDRFQLMVDAFRERRKNIFMTRENLNPTMGLGTMIVSGNVGEAFGQGIDMSLEYSKNFLSGFWLQTRGTFTYAHSHYIQNEEPNYANTPWRSRIGQPIYGTMGYVAERLFIDDDEVADSPEQLFGGGETMGGDIKYMDINKDGKISSLDQIPLGYPRIPEINYGFGFSAGYKGFDVSAYFQGLARESFFINPQLIAPFTSVTYAGENNDNVVLQNQLLQAIADSYWSEQNQDSYAFWPRLNTIAGGNNMQTSSWWLRSGDFLRLKQVDIGYSFKESLISRLKMKTLRIYATGTNLFAWSNFKLWDVEMAGGGLGYPLQRVYNLGVQINF